jgi:chorismate mutase
VAALIVWPTRQICKSIRRLTDWPTHRSSTLSCYRRIARVTHTPIDQGVRVAVRAIRGAIQVDADDPDQIYAGVHELLATILERNGLAPADVISIFFTSTPDLVSCFPAAGARQVGFTDVPMLCAHEIGVEGSLARTVRLLAHVETPKQRAEIRHAFLGAAASLRDDLPQ